MKAIFVLKGWRRTS
ncbi:trp operon leader peptide [Escherichia coli]|nr:trp operon leader peptide [Escherichia coli]EJS6185392.1 trp operon leader peptide [Escherichia coli]ELT7742856.1 trp operon leader peptide [Escherichia coli]UQX40936.1 trp operon leader peptide [Escherichia coli]HDI9159489.1 trp operon leader peptide [Escherichia coli]